MTMYSAEARGICLPKLKKSMQCLRKVTNMTPASQVQEKELNHQYEFGTFLVWILVLLLSSFQFDAGHIYLITVCFIFRYIKLK